MNYRTKILRAGHLATNDKQVARQLHSDERTQRSIDNLDLESTPQQRRELSSEISHLSNYLTRRLHQQIAMMGSGLHTQSKAIAAYEHRNRWRI